MITGICKVKINKNKYSKMTSLCVETSSVPWQKLVGKCQEGFENCKNCSCTMRRALAYYFCIYLVHEFMSEFIANVIDLAKKKIGSFRKILSDYYGLPKRTNSNKWYLFHHLSSSDHFFSTEKNEVQKLSKFHSYIFQLQLKRKQFGFRKEKFRAK